MSEISEKKIKFEKVKFLEICQQGKITLEFSSIVEKIKKYSIFLDANDFNTVMEILGRAGASIKEVFESLVEIGLENQDSQVSFDDYNETEKEETPLLCG